jgi:hypothetical protein
VNSKITTVTSVILLLILLTAAIVVSTTAATTATATTTATPPTDIEVVDSDQIIQQISSMLDSSRLVDYQLYSNGTAEYTIEFVQPGASQSNWKNFTVITEHRYTPQNNYASITRQAI